jgi:hypothetical protein
MSIENWFLGLDTKTQAALISFIFGSVFGATAGIIAPFVQGVVQDRSARRRILFEAQSNRQAKLIDAQSAFIDDLSKAIWDWRYLSMRVTYHGSSGLRGQEYERDLTLYKEEIWQRFNQIRYCASRSRRLISDRSYQRLKDFYVCSVVEFDKRIQSAMEDRDPIRKEVLFMELNNDLFVDITDHIDNLLLELSNELQLSSSNPMKGGHQ